MPSSSHPAPLPLGTVVCGYRLESVVGHGGFGITYLGRDLSNQAEVVIKENLPQSCVARAEGQYAVTVLPGKNGTGKGSFAWATQSFLNEARTLASFSHPGIVSVLHAFHTDATGTDFYVMPHIRGKSFSDIIRLGTPISREWLLYVMAVLLNALAYVHRKGFLHRDIKPDNILLEENGSPVLIDFGASRPMDQGNNTVVLTPSYSPVEQRRGIGEGPYTDVYALGATLYHLVSGGQVPSFELRVGSHDEFKPLASDSRLVQQYGRAVLGSIDKAVGVEPEDRFENATAWCAVLQNEPGFQSEQPVLLDAGGVSPPLRSQPLTMAGTPLPIAPPPVSAKRGKGVAAVLAGCFIAATAAALVWICLTPGGELQAGAGGEKNGAAQPGSVETGKDDGGEAAPAPLAQEVRKRVLARPDSTLFKDATSEETIGDQLPLYAVYYIVSESGDRYEVAEEPDGAGIGWIKRDDVHMWNNNLALQFTHPGGALQRRRDPALFFEKWENAQKYFRMSENERCNIMDRVRSKAAPDAGLGLLAKEPDKWNPRSNCSLLPVLEYHRVEKGGDAGKRTKDELYLHTVALNYTGASAAAAGNKAAGDEKGGEGGGSTVAQRNLPDVDVVFVVDTSRSMQPYIDTICGYLKGKAKEIERQTQGRAKFGFVGFRDFSLDGKGRVNKQLCDYVTHIYTQEKMLSAGEFSDISQNIRATEKDSIDYAEDVLAGIKDAINGIPWRNRSIRIIYVVGDACGRSGNTEVGDREEKGLCNCAPSIWKNRGRGSLSGFSPTQIQGLCESAVKEGDKSSNYAIFPMYILAPPVHDKRNGGVPKPLFFQEDWRGKCNISQDAWDDHVRKGIEFFKSLTLEHHHLQGDGNKQNGDLATVYTLDGMDEKLMDYISKLSRKYDMKIELKPFDVAFRESLDEIVGQVENPQIPKEKAPQHSAMQRLFQDAYLEWCAANDLDETDDEGRATEIHGWTSAQDASDRDVVRAGVVLSRKQLESLTVQLDDLVNALHSGEEDSVTSTMNELFDLMLLTATDPNLDPDSKRMKDDTVNRYMQNLPWKTYLLQYYDAVIRRGDGITAQAKNDLVKQLFEKYEYLRTLGESGNWTKDNTDKQKDLIVIPLNQLP